MQVKWLCQRRGNYMPKMWWEAVKLSVSCGLNTVLLYFLLGVSFFLVINPKAP